MVMGIPRGGVPQLYFGDVAIFKKKRLVWNYTIIFETFFFIGKADHKIYLLLYTALEVIFLKKYVKLHDYLKKIIYDPLHAA